MGAAAGFSAGANARNQREQRIMLKQQRDQELAKQGYYFDDNNNMFVRPGSAAQAEQMQANEAVQLAKSTQAKLAAMDTDNAFANYAESGDASYLQKALDNNPYLKSTWAQQGVHLLSNIDFGSDGKLLGNSGFTESMYDTPEKQNTIKRNMYKFYDGKTWQLGNLSETAAELGVTNRLGDLKSSSIYKNQEDLFSLLSGPKVHTYTADGHKYQKEIELAANETGIPADLIASMMKQESGNNPNAVSQKGAQGLMQLMPATAKELGVTDITDPVQNIKAGATYLKQMLDKYGGDIQKALAAYNAGPGNVDKYGGVPPFAETQQYVNKVLGNYNDGGKYYGNTSDTLKQQMVTPYQQAQQTQDIILGDQARRVQATQGLEPGMAQAKLEQTNKELALKAEANQIDWVKALAAKKSAESGDTTAAQKDITAAQNTTTEMLNTFGGEEKFFSNNFSNPADARKAYPFITKIEKLEGTQLSEQDKKDISDLRQMIALADPAVNLTEAETGIFDKSLNQAKSYLSEQIGGKKATTAYAAMRNIFRHSLYGAALTGSEIDAFNDAYGTLGQKAGPVRAALATMLTQEKSKLETVMALQNPYSAHVRLGADKEKLGRITNSLDSAIALIEGKLTKEDYLKSIGKSSTNAQPNTTQQTSSSQPTNGNRKSLDEIFGNPIKGQ